MGVAASVGAALNLGIERRTDAALYEAVPRRVRTSRPAQRHKSATDSLAVKSRLPRLHCCDDAVIRRRKLVNSATRIVVEKSP
jgi:hypothetical protein